MSAALGIMLSVVAASRKYSPHTTYTPETNERFQPGMVR